MESTFRHSGWHTRRMAVLRSLQRTGVGHRRLESFCDCGANSSCEQLPDEIRLRGSGCKHRMCEPCLQERAAKIRSALLPLCQEKEIRFLTLTLKHGKTPLRDQLDRLYRSFAVLRRREAWKQHVRGGAAFCEVKLSEKDGLFHPHLHVLVEGSWWENKEISEEWHAVTGDSYIIDITRPRQIDDCARYCVGYCCKTIHASIFRDDATLDETQMALRGRRLCTTFGSWRGVPLEPTDKDDRAWVILGSLDTVIRRARDGITACIRWLEAAQRRYPSLAQCTLHPTSSDEEFDPLRDL